MCRHCIFQIFGITKKILKLKSSSCRDGKLVPMRKPLIEEIFTIQEEANYSPNYKTMDLAMYEFSRGLQVSLSVSLPLLPSTPKL